MINKVNLIEHIDKKILIALSGGPDSVFLLTECLKLFKPKNIIACHVNYNYRKDSINDLNLCHKLCDLYGIRLEVLEIDNDYSKQKQNFENWAREIRYDFFSKVLKEKKFDIVFTGHNLNDFVESYLIQLERKTNTDYFGIKDNVLINDIKIFRPLLNCLKSFIYKELRILKQNKKINGFAIDSTNEDIRFLRNRIRKKLSDSDVLKYKTIIDNLNKGNNKLNNIVEDFYIDKNILYLNKLKHFDNELKLKIIYKFLTNSVYGGEFIRSKKSRIREVLKICNSEKSLITCNFGKCFLIKDRNKIYLENVFYFKNYDLINLKNDIAQKFDNYIYLKHNYVKNIPYIFSNNWRKYKNFYLEKSKIKIVDMYKKLKTPYILRFKNLLIVDMKNKNVIVSYFNKKERE